MAPPLPLRVVNVRRWLVCVEQRLLHQSDECIGTASILARHNVPDFVDFRPRLGRGDMLPPWTAYPNYSSVSSGWQQGYGDGYLQHWYKWLEALTITDRNNYLAKHTIPDDDRLWPDWFESAVRRQFTMKIG